MNILAVGAHPDDIEFGCAAVLLQEIARGHNVHNLVLSHGEAGSSGTPEQRQQEAQEAAELMGASIAFLEFGGDCHLAATPDAAMAMAAVIRKTKPQILLAPHPAPNQHPDHAATGRLVRDACRFARYGGLSDLKPLPPFAPGALYFYNITRHGAEPPDIVIDITPVVDQWEAVMNCHQTQIASKNYLDLQKSAARLLGLSVGVAYAAGLYVNDPVRVESLSSLTLTSRCY